MAQVSLEWLLYTGIDIYNGPIDNIPALVQIMALAPTIYRRQAIIWTHDGKFIDAYTRHSASIS